MTARGSQGLLGRLEKHPSAEQPACNGTVGLIVSICVQLSTVSKGYFPAWQVLIKSQKCSTKENVKDRHPLLRFLTSCGEAWHGHGGEQGCRPHSFPTVHPQFLTVLTDL